MAENLKEVIASLERQRTAIERALAALREVEGVGSGSPGPGRPKGSGTKHAGRPAGRGRISAEGRRRLAEAMKRRWAVKRAAAAVKRPKK